MHFKPTRRNFAASIAFLVLTVGAASVASRPAQSRVEFEPMDIVTPAPITPGEPLECDVTLTGAPVNVTIYSDPPGAVSYSGTVTSSTPAIQADTSSDIDVDGVTVYCVTDGSTVVSTGCAVDTDSNGYPGG